jgi:hypothetical protein
MRRNGFIGRQRAGGRLYQDAFRIIAADLK